MTAPGVRTWSSSRERLGRVATKSRETRALLGTGGTDAYRGFSRTENGTVMADLSIKGDPTKIELVKTVDEYGQSTGTLQEIDAEIEYENAWVKTVGRGMQVVGLIPGLQAVGVAGTFMVMAHDLDNKVMTPENAVLGGASAIGGAFGKAFAGTVQGKMIVDGVNLGIATAREDYAGMAVAGSGFLPVGPLLQSATRAGGIGYQSYEAAMRGDYGGALINLGSLPGSFGGDKDGKIANLTQLVGGGYGTGQAIEAGDYGTAIAYGGRLPFQLGIDDDRTFMGISDYLQAGYKIASYEFGKDDLVSEILNIAPSVTEDIKRGTDNLVYRSAPKLELTEDGRGITAESAEALEDYFAGYGQRFIDDGSLDQTALSLDLQRSRLNARERHLVSGLGGQLFPAKLEMYDLVVRHPEDGQSRTVSVRADELDRALAALDAQGYELIDETSRLLPDPRVDAHHRESREVGFVGASGQERSVPAIDVRAGENHNVVLVWISPEDDTQQSSRELSPDEVTEAIVDIVRSGVPMGSILGQRVAASEETDNATPEGADGSAAPANHYVTWTEHGRGTASASLSYADLKGFGQALIARGVDPRSIGVVSASTADAAPSVEDADGHGDDLALPYIAVDAENNLVFDAEDLADYGEALRERYSLDDGDPSDFLAAREEIERSGIHQLDPAVGRSLLTDLHQDGSVPDTIDAPLPEGGGADDSSNGSLPILSADKVETFDLRVPGGKSVTPSGTGTEPTAGDDAAAALPEEKVESSAVPKLDARKVPKLTPDDVDGQHSVVFDAQGAREGEEFKALGDGLKVGIIKSGYMGPNPVIPYVFGDGTAQGEGQPDIVDDIKQILDAGGNPARIVLLSPTEDGGLEVSDKSVKTLFSDYIRPSDTSDEKQLAWTKHTLIGLIGEEGKVGLKNEVTGEVEIQRTVDWRTGEEEAGYVTLSAVMHAGVPSEEIYLVGQGEDPNSAETLFEHRDEVRYYKDGSSTEDIPPGDAPETSDPEQGSDPNATASPNAPEPNSSDTAESVDTTEVISAVDEELPAFGLPPGTPTLTLDPNAHENADSDGS